MTGKREKKLLMGKNKIEIPKERKEGMTEGR